METELEEETYSKIIYVIIGILTIIIFILILDIITGGTLFSSIICMIVFYIPLTGSNLATRIGCSGIAL